MLAVLILIQRGVIPISHRRRHLGAWRQHQAAETGLNPEWGVCNFCLLGSCDACPAASVLGVE